MEWGELHPSLYLSLSLPIHSYCFSGSAHLKVTGDLHLGRFSVCFSVFISLARSATVFLFSFSCSFWVFSRAPWSVSWFGPENFPVFPLYTLPWWSQPKPSFAWGQVQMTCRSRSPAHISLLFPDLFQHPISPPHILSFITSACFWFSS